jgi:hypothetical protein
MNSKPKIPPQMRGRLALLMLRDALIAVVTLQGTALATCGFSPTGGFEAYRELAERVRGK